jgi:hypothetical protein
MSRQLLTHFSQHRHLIYEALQNQASQDDPVITGTVYPQYSDLVLSPVGAMQSMPRR